MQLLGWQMSLASRTVWRSGRCRLLLPCECCGGRDGSGPGRTTDVPQAPQSGNHFTEARQGGAARTPQNWYSGIRSAQNLCLWVRMTAWLHIDNVGRAAHHMNIRCAAAVRGVEGNIPRTCQLQPPRARPLPCSTHLHSSQTQPLDTVFRPQKTTTKQGDIQIQLSYCG